MQAVLNWLYMLWETTVSWLFSIFPLPNISVGLLILAFIVFDLAFDVLVLRGRR